MKKYLNTPKEVIDALQAGKKVETEDLEYKFINGILVATGKTDKHWIVYPALYSGIVPYTNEPESLKLEVGKFYKTRCGKKAIVLGKEDVDDGFPIHVALMNYYANAFYVSVSGRYNIDGSDNELDLIGPWEE